MNGELGSMAAGLAHVASVSAEERATWPPELLQFADARALRWDVDHPGSLGGHRQRVAVQLAAEALGETFIFAYATVHWLAAQVPFDSLEGHLLDELSSCLFGLVEGAVAETLRVAPALSAAMPFDSGAELLAAVRAQVAETAATAAQAEGETGEE